MFQRHRVRTETEGLQMVELGQSGTHFEDNSKMLQPIWRVIEVSI